MTRIVRTGPDEVPAHHEAPDPEPEPEPEE